MKKRPSMIGTPPSASQVSLDPALHARDFARRNAEPLDSYCRARMKQLGIPDQKIGEPDYDGDGKWRVFNPNGMQGGNNTTGITIDSGALNADRLKGQKGCRIYPHMRLRDRIDAIIAHEEAELRVRKHVDALKEAAKTELPISEGARRLCKAMAR